MNRFFPLLQGIAIVCLGFSALQFIDTVPPYSSTRDTILIGFVTVAVLLGALWFIRTRLTTGSGRATVSITVIILISVCVMFGQIGFGIPALILAMCFVVLDCGTRTALWVSAVQTIVWIVVPLFVLNTGWPLWMVLLNVLPITVLAAFGTLLGIIVRDLSRLVALQKDTIRERDEALLAAARNAAAQRDLALAHERDRAAQELHDGLGNQLTLIGMLLEFAQRMRERDAETAWSKITQARSVVSDAMVDMRSWVRGEGRSASPAPDNNPHVEAPGTLITALEAIAEPYRGAGLEVTITPLCHGLELPASTAEALGRDLAECLSNAVRHAHAKRVDVTLEQDNSTVTMRVTNKVPAHLMPATNSVSATGSDADYPDPPRGRGIRGIQTRARQAGGHASIRISDEGFAVQVTIPTQKVSES